MAKDYYDILGVKKTDSVDTIKKSYKKLAMKYHPDKVKDDQKEEYETKFKEISEAYNTLSNPDKKRQYDMGGSNPFNQSSGHSQGGGFSDIFEEFFRGGSFDGGSNEIEEDLDLHYQITIEFIDAAYGIEKEIQLKRDIKCEKCDGSGSENGKFDECKKCLGRGVIEINRRTPFGVMRGTAKCDDCEGLGKIPKKKCKACKGNGVQNQKDKIKIKIPKGIDNGQTLRISNSGNESKNNYAGDLFLTILIKPHKIFRRKNFDIFMDLPITFAQAALGDEIKIPTLDDEKIKIKIQKGTESGSVLRIKEKGIPYIDDPFYLGDLYINIIVKTPRKLSRAQVKLFEELKRLD